MVKFLPDYMTKETISILPLQIFYTVIVTAFAYGLYFLFISQLVRNLYSDLFWGGHRILSATYYKFKVDFF